MRRGRGVLSQPQTFDLSLQGFADAATVLLQHRAINFLFAKISIPHLTAIMLLCYATYSLIHVLIDARDVLFAEPKPQQLDLGDPDDAKPTGEPMAIALFDPSIDVFAVEPHAGDEVPDADMAESLDELQKPVVVIEGTVEGLEDAAAQLTERYDRLYALERDLATREAVLSALRERLLADVDRFAELRDEIAILLEGLSEQDERRITRLVKTYETMKAKKAAVIFNQLELSVILQVVDRMREAKVAAILSSMDPMKAKIVTSRLAEKLKRPSLPR